jgi:hypothetical protein
LDDLQNFPRNTQSFNCRNMATALNDETTKQRRSEETNSVERLIMTKILFSTLTYHSCVYESHSWLCVVNPGANFTADITFGRQRTQQQSSLNIKSSWLGRTTWWNQWRGHDCGIRTGGTPAPLSCCPPAAPPAPPAPPACAILNCTSGSISDSGSIGYIYGFCRHTWSEGHHPLNTQSTQLVANFLHTRTGTENIKLATTFTHTAAARMS